MANDNSLQSPNVEPRHCMLQLAGYAAATTFCAVSVSANLQYGLSLGKTPIDKATYAAASVAADVFKIAAPLLALTLWNKRSYILALAGLSLWLGCVGWSMASAVGFVVSSRGEVVAERVAEVATRHGWEAKVERAETQLATLGNYRPPDVIKAELASAVVPLHIWRRSRQCTDLTLEQSRSACAPVLGLRKELAAAEAAERLEGQLAAARAELAAMAVAGSLPDPQASALARLFGAGEPAVRTSIALILAGLIEAGSALGFTLVSVATSRNPPSRPAPRQHVAQQRNAASRRARHTRRPVNAEAIERRVQTQHKGERAVGKRAREACGHLCPLAGSGGLPSPPAPPSVPGLKHLAATAQPSSNAARLEWWVQTRLKVGAGGSIPARDAYADFCRWAHAAGVEPCTETRFGRDFSARIIGLGGLKVKRRDRAYYQGATLKMPPGPKAAFQAAA